MVELSTFVSLPAPWEWWDELLVVGMREVPSLKKDGNVNPRSH